MIASVAVSGKSSCLCVFDQRTVLSTVSLSCLGPCQQPLIDVIGLSTSVNMAQQAVYYLKQAVVDVFGIFRNVFIFSNH